MQGAQLKYLVLRLQHHETKNDFFFCYRLLQVHHDENVAHGRAGPNCAVASTNARRWESDKAKVAASVVHHFGAGAHRFHAIAEGDDDDREIDVEDLVCERWQPASTVQLHQEEVAGEAEHARVAKQWNAIDQVYAYPSVHSEMYDSRDVLASVRYDSVMMCPTAFAPAKSAAGTTM